MKITLIRLQSKFLISDYAMPSLGILYLSSVLKQHGHQVNVIDDITKLVVDGSDIFGVSCITPQFDSAKEILKLIKSYRPDAWVIAGGPHATVMPQDFLNTGFDQVVVGEGENAVLKIIMGCKDKIIEEEYIKNLDDIPFPDRKAIDLHAYKYKIKDRDSTTIITQRGCPYNKCVFCCKVWNKVRYHSSDYVKKELQEIKNLGFNALTIFDDLFFSYYSRDKEIISELGRLDFLWRCISKTTHVLLNKKNIEHAAENGCVEIALGIESASNIILKNINKGLTVDVHKRAIDLIRKCGIEFKINIVLGLPGESWETIAETDKFLNDTQPDWVDINCLVVYPGTDLWENAEKYGLQISDQYLPFKRKTSEYVLNSVPQGLSNEELLKAREYLEKKYRKDKLSQ